MAHRAFIVRPFNPADDINFKEVDSSLITPALRALRIEGGTTELFDAAGSVHVDMLHELVTADLVIADVSLRNANVFYELGIRQALRQRHTFLIRAKKPDGSTGDDQTVPFDIVGEWYFTYDPEDPARSVEDLKRALEQTLLPDRQPDSPVFRLVPGLKAQDVTPFLKAPQTFEEEVDLAKDDVPKLNLLSTEARTFPWVSAGLRHVGRALFNLRLGFSSEPIWKDLIKSDISDVEANLKLGTIHHRKAMLKPRKILQSSYAAQLAVSELQRLENSAPSSVAVPHWERDPERDAELALSNQFFQRVATNRLALGVLVGYLVAGMGRASA
jgi:hypothetical protein